MSTAGSALGARIRRRVLRSAQPTLGDVVILRFATLTVYLTNSAAVLMQGYGMSPSEFGAAFAIVALSSSAGNLPNSRLVERMPLARLTIRALLAAALGFGQTVIPAPITGLVALLYVSHPARVDS